MPGIRSQIEKLVGRTLVGDEERIITWLEGWDEYTAGAIQLLVLAAYHNGQRSTRKAKDEGQTLLVNVLMAADVEFHLDVTGLHFDSDEDEEKGQRIAFAMKLGYLLE